MAANNIFTSLAYPSGGVPTTPVNTGTDAFGRLRVSTPDTLFDSKLRYGKNTTQWAEELGGAGTSVWDSNNSCVNLGVTSGTDYAVRQTRQRYHYQPGKSQLIDMTGVLAPSAGTKRVIGAVQLSISGTHLPQDGVCFESIGTIVYCSVYKGGVATRVPQADWEDALDGTGASGIIVDWAKTLIFQIDYQWLGVGTVRFGIVVGGALHIVYRSHHSNILTNVYMLSGNQPCAYGLWSTGGAGSLRQICASVMSEGGSIPSGLVAYLDSGAASSIAVGPTLELVMAIRLKASELDSVVDILSADILSVTNNTSIRWSLCWNAVITGTPNWVDVPGASVQRWVASGAEAVTPTIEIDGGYVSGLVRGVGAQNLGNLRLGSDVNGAQDVISLCAQGIGGAVNVYGGMTLRQQP